MLAGLGLIVWQGVLARDLCFSFGTTLGSIRHNISNPLNRNSNGISQVLHVLLPERWLMPRPSPAVRRAPGRRCFWSDPASAMISLAFTQPPLCSPCMQRMPAATPGSQRGVSGKTRLSKDMDLFISSSPTNTVRQQFPFCLFSSISHHAVNAPTTIATGLTLFSDLTGLLPLTWQHFC